MGELGGVGGGSGWLKNAGKSSSGTSTIGALADRGERFACNFEGLTRPIETKHSMGFTLDIASFHWLKNQAIW